jgi:beta-N-acetylhexosaminidase
MRLLIFSVFLFTNLMSSAQRVSDKAASHWADSVYRTLDDNQRIGQLIIARLSTWDGKTKKVTFLNAQVEDYVKKYNIGSVCLFQGAPEVQAKMMNRLRELSKTPILFSIDGEWGLGMRMTDSVMALPRQMMLGAVSDSSIIYDYGKIVARQCKKLGIHLNYAPVVDVNNNPDNPVINDRSFGEDKYKVASFGIQYMKGMQDEGVMACAKHFPGHGDVSVDSHLDLPVIKKSMETLKATELFPFKKMIEAGVGSVMVGHLFIPAIDNEANRPTSISKKNVTDLLRKEMGFGGLAITDALEMQGVKKFFPNGAASVESLIAGNDMLCLPDSIPMTIEKIKKAIKSGKLKWSNIEHHCKRVLQAKFQYVKDAYAQTDTALLSKNLNAEVAGMKRRVAEAAITLVAKENRNYFPFTPDQNEKIAYIGIGLKNKNNFANLMQNELGATVFTFDYTSKRKSAIDSLLNQLKTGYKHIIIGIHQLNRAPANNFGMSNEAVTLVTQLQQQTDCITFLFGNAYAAKNWCSAPNLVICYEDDSIVQQTAFDLLKGNLIYKGKLPVTVCESFHYGYGLTTFTKIPENQLLPAEQIAHIDSTIEDAVKKKALPGCALMVLKDGKIALEKYYGHYDYCGDVPVTASAVYDLASITKILATTVSVMKLSEEQRINIDDSISTYLTETIGTNKSGVTIKQLLLHEAGMIPFVPFYKETLDSTGMADALHYSRMMMKPDDVLVAADLFIHRKWVDSFYNSILYSPRTESGKYVYSDIDFILLGKIIERVTGEKLNDYVERNFFLPMGLGQMRFLPLQHIRYDLIVPTADEINFRHQVLRGFVHDPGAALMGGVSGHAGLFGNAEDVAVMMQMLLNRGEWNGKRYLKKTTIDEFTQYQSAISRRGLGFDKPEKNNNERAAPYPCLSASSQTFGHTGFTGTCAWADPEKKIVFVFLSNRTYPEENNNFKNLNLRSKIQEAVYFSWK